MQNITRRRFLEQSLLTAAAAGFGLEEAARSEPITFMQSKLEFDIEQDTLDRDRIPIGADH